MKTSDELKDALTTASALIHQVSTHIAQLEQSNQVLREALKMFQHESGCFCTETPPACYSTRHYDYCIIANRALSTTTPTTQWVRREVADKVFENLIHTRRELKDRTQLRLECMEEGAMIISTYEAATKPTP